MTRRDINIKKKEKKSPHTDHFLDDSYQTNRVTKYARNIVAMLGTLQQCQEHCSNASKMHDYVVPLETGEGEHLEYCDDCKHWAFFSQQEKKRHWNLVHNGVPTRSFLTDQFICNFVDPVSLMYLPKKLKSNLATIKLYPKQVLWIYGLKINDVISLARLL